MKVGDKRLRLGLKINRVDRALIFVVSFLIIIVLFVFRSYTQTVERDQKELITLSMEKLAESQKKQFETYIEDKINLLEVWASYPDIYNMERSQQRLYLNRCASALGFQHMFVVDTEGIGYYFKESTERDHSKEPFFDSIMHNDVYLTEPFYAENSPSIMTACVSIYNTREEKVGVLCGAIRLDKLRNMIRDSEMMLNGDCFIVNRAGNYITSTNEVNVNNQSSIFDQSNSNVQAIAEAFTMETDTSGVITIEGVEYLSYVTYLEDYKWGVVQIIPMEEITARFEYMGWMQGALILLTVILMVCTIRIFYCWKKSDKKIYTDTLTQCNSRAACIGILESLENQKKMDISIIYMDLNKFKYVNDTFGHDKGDQLLRIFGSVLDSVFGKVGFVGRMGGDEFVAVLADVTEEDIEKLCKKVEKKLKKRSEELEFEYVISSSYGWATRAKGEDITLDELQQLADERMYRNKAELKEKKSN